MLRQFLRYNLVGLINTVVGFGLIMLLMYMGINAVLSNAIGYGIGAILSYFLNKHYTFTYKNDSMRVAIKFFAVLGVAYLLNYMVLMTLLATINPYIAQAVSAVVYTLSAFIMMKFLVFRNLK
ncbi:MAG: GtrA family protein [Epsilonproteobacteria bacterium]|nr:GtrA family protein [Campylobacterota bacterium]